MHSNDRNFGKRFKKLIIVFIVSKKNDIQPETATFSSR